MKVSEHKRRETEEPYFVLSYETEDEGFYLYKKEDKIFYPRAILVYPKVTQWTALINWADWESTDTRTVFTEGFFVHEKQIVAADENQEVTDMHRGLWIHCAMKLKKFVADKKVETPAGAHIIVTEPVWKAWKRPTVKQFYDTGETLF